jgi:hypothetical protein
MRRINNIGQAFKGERTMNKAQTARAMLPEDAAAKEEFAYALAIQAYLFAFPLTMLERERKRRVNVTAPVPDEPMAPANQLGHMRNLSTAKGNLPYSPNNDTAYTGILLELRDEPVVLHIPDMGDRFFIVTISDAYMENIPNVMGTRLSGGKGGNILFAGPHWNGTVPEGMILARLPTISGIGVVRTRVYGFDDVPEVNRLQDLMSMTSLSDWDNGKGMGKKAPSAPNMLPRPDYTGDFAYFRTVTDLLTENPPRPEHNDILKTFETIGIKLGQPYNPDLLDEPTRRGVLRAEKVGLDILKWKMKSRGTALPHNWGTLVQGSRYGQDCLCRAELAYSGLVMNDPEDAIYFLNYRDSNGNMMEGGKRYVVHFDKLPPVQSKGFWSLTMYAGEKFQFVDNPIDRYAVGSKTEGLRFNDDGSIDIYVQPTAPEGDNSSNWLPSPTEGQVRMNIRAYMPFPEFLDVETMGTYMPSITPLDD